MPKKGRRSGQDEALGAGPGGLGGDEDYDWIKYLGEGRSSASAGSSAATSAATSTALQSPARPVPARTAPAQPVPARTTAPARTARPAAPRPAVEPGRFGLEVDQPADGDTDPGGPLPRGGPVPRGGTGTGRGLGGRRAAGRRAEPPQPYEAQQYQSEPYQPEPYQSEPYQSEPYQSEPYQPEPYEPQSYEPQSYDPGPARRFGRKDRAHRTSRSDRTGAGGWPAGDDGPGRRGGTGPLPAAGRARRSEPDQRGGYPPVQPSGAGTRSSAAGPQGPGRAVKVRQGRTTDLLFNPAAEDYGQPLYAPDAGEAGRQRGDRFTSPQRRLDTAEYAKPLYPDPALESGPATDARPRRSRPGADRLGDTEARGRPVPGDRRSGRTRRGGRAAAALPGPDRTGAQRRIDDLSGADPRTTGPQQRIGELPGPDPFTGQRRERTGPQPRIGELPGLDPFTGQPRERTGPQPRIGELGDVEQFTGPRRAERTSQQRRADGLSRPDPLTDSGIGVLWESEPAAGVAPEAAITKAPGQQAGTGPLDWQAFDVAEPLAEPADLPGTAPRGKPARKPPKGTRKAAAARPKPVASRPRSGRRKKATALLGGLVIIVVLAAVGYFKLMPRTSHTVSAPASVGGYVKQQANATANNLRQRIVTAAAGDVKNVVAAVYEQKTGPGTSKGPQIVVLIGGNLTGNASAGDLISAFMARLHGSFTTSPGSLGGQAACAPGSHGGPSECAWADGDTFGVVVSATQSAKGLADEMRQMRPLVEHVAR